MKEIFVVQGTTGEYSDRTDWLVCAMYNEDAAQKFALELAALGREAFSVNESSYGSWRKSEAGKNLLAQDSRASIDYTGIDYTVLKVEIKD